MPRHADLLAAQQAASACVHASKCLLFVANDPGIGPYGPGLIAKHLDELTRAFPVAGDAIPRVENDLSPEAPGLVEAGGMARPTAHRLALDLATDLAESVREIDPRLVPREPSGPPWRPYVAFDLVKEHLPAIVAKLAAKPPVDARLIKSLIERDFRRIKSLIEREWWDATARLNAAAGPLADLFPGIGLFRPAAPSPSVGSDGRTEATASPAGSPRRCAGPPRTPSPRSIIFGPNSERKRAAIPASDTSWSNRPAPTRCPMSRPCPASSREGELPRRPTRNTVGSGYSSTATIND